MNIKIIKKSNDIDKVISWCLNQQILGFDTEATGLDPFEDKILTIQVGTPERQYVIDTYRVGRPGILKLLNAIKDKILVIHNAKYDYKMVKSNYQITLNNMKCTMVASMLLTMGNSKCSHDLQYLLENRMNIKISKEQRVTFFKFKYGNEFTQDQLEYAGKDTEYLVPLYLQLQKELNNRGQSELSQLEYDTIKVTGDMELSGISIDKQLWCKLEGIAKQNAIKTKLALDKYFPNYEVPTLFGSVVNLNYDSAKQMKEALSKLVGKKLESTDAKYLKTISHPAISVFLEYKKSKKLITTYGSKFLEDNINPITDKIHTNFNQLGADSGRYSSSNPKILGLSIGIYYEK